MPALSFHLSPFRYLVRRLQTINGQPPTLTSSPSSHASSLLSCRPRPLYFIPHGHNSILSPLTMAELAHKDPDHPRIQKHKASYLAIKYFHIDFHPRPEDHLSYSCAPHQSKVLYDHYDINYLFLPTDLKLSSIHLWRIIFGRASIIFQVTRSLSPLTKLSIFNSDAPHLMNFIMYLKREESQLAIVRLARIITHYSTTPPLPNQMA